MPGVSIGLHSTFTDGKPLSPRNRIPSLLDSAGNFSAYPAMMKRAKAKQLSSDEIFHELMAQYEVLRQQIGDRLTFVDSHHSIHNKLLPFRDAFLRFGRESGVAAIRTRQMYYLDVTGNNAQLVRPDIGTIHRFGLRKVLANYFYRNRTKEFAKVYKTADGMIVEDGLGAMNVFKGLLSLDLSGQQGKIYYAVTHPATSIDDLPESNLKEQRIEEFFILKSNEFVEFVRKHPLENFDLGMSAL